MWQCLLMFSAATNRSRDNKCGPHRVSILNKHCETVELIIVVRSIRDNVGSLTTFRQQLLVLSTGLHPDETHPYFGFRSNRLKFACRYQSYYLIVANTLRTNHVT